MTTLDAAIYSYLTDATIMQVVKMVRPIRLPQGPNNTIDPTARFPALIYQYVTRPQEYSHDGPEDHRNPLLQLDLYAKSQTELVTVAETIRPHFWGVRIQIGTVKFTGIKLVNEFDVDTQDVNLFRRLFEVRTPYEQTAP